MEKKIILALDMVVGESIVPSSITVCSDKNVLIALSIMVATSHM